MKPLQKILIFISYLTVLTLSAQNKNIFKLDRNYFVLNAKNVNILEKADGEQITIPQGIKLLIPLSNGNYFTSSNSKEFQEVIRYDEIVLLDKNFTSISTKSNLKDFSFNISVGGLYVINTQNNTYISVFNPTKITNNVIDQNGALVFDKDTYGSIYPQFEGFATFKSSESAEPIVYNFETKKNIVFPAKYNVFNTLKNSKLFVLKNKETNDFALYDPKTSKVIFISKYEISDITEISNENNSKDKKSKNYFIEYVSKSEKRIVDTKGNIILSGNFNVKYFNESTKEFYLDDNATSLLNQKNNYYNIETKSYKFPEFVKDINSNNFLLWYKRNDYATVINIIDNNAIYTDSDFVKDVTNHSTNLSLILKQKPGEPYFYDIYSGITNKVIFKDTKGLSYIDGTSKYLKLSITFSTFAIVDLNGDIILKERNNPDGKLKFNKGKFDVVDRKGKVKETIERD